MDTCLGQMIEVEATFRGFADAIAASEDSIGYTGVEYAEVLGKLQARPGMGAAALAKAAAASYRTGHDKWTLASSAVALDWRWDRLVRQVDLLAWKLRRRHAQAPARLRGAPTGAWPRRLRRPDQRRPLRRGGPAATERRLVDAATHLP